jgi:hypothetical protein
MNAERFRGLSVACGILSPPAQPSPMAEKGWVCGQVTHGGCMARRPLNDEGNMRQVAGDFLRDIGL